MIEITNLTCGYLNFFLQDINLKIQRTEFIGIIGPNGSGKTTLLKAMTRIIKPKSGSIILEGKDIWKISILELARKIAVVSQNLEINFIKVEDFVLLGRIPYYKKFQFFETEKDLEIAKKSMELTDILEFKNRYLAEISAGERQLVYIAKALTQQPEILLLDEPTTYLDITHQVKVLNLIRRLNKEFGLTVVVVFHDLNLASEYCSRLILLDKGRMYKDAPATEILNCQIIEEVYKTKVVVEKNPVSFKPYIFLVSEKDEKNRVN